MIRDMSLVRQILLELEQDTRWGTIAEVEIDGYPDDLVSYHVKLLGEAGYIDAVDFSSSGAVDWRVRGLTWSGHEFLDAIRNDSVWDKTKKIIAEYGGAVPADLVKAVAVKALTNLLGLA